MLMLGKTHSSDSPDEVAVSGRSRSEALCLNFGRPGSHPSAHLATGPTGQAGSGVPLDWLTGLLDRSGWQERLTGEDADCARSGRSSGIVVVEVDELRRVTDTLGWAAGHALLTRTADVLIRGSGARHTVARIGHDEFAVLAVESERDRLAAQVRRLRAMLRVARVPASLGWAVREPEGGLPGAWLAADRQMALAKRARWARIVQARGLRPLSQTVS
jgi:diguanylate cyclase (GGDEF)-like protein